MPRVSKSHENQGERSAQGHQMYSHIEPPQIKKREEPAIEFLRELVKNKSLEISKQKEV